jgi:oligosaccharide repeat unit polymerase
MDELNHITAIFLSLGILGLGYWLKEACSTWAAPAPLFCLFWFFFSFIPLIGLLTAPVNPLAIGYILLCCLAFSAPAIFTDWQPLLMANSLNARFRTGYLSTPFIWWVFTSSFVIAVSFLLLDLLVQGITWREMLLNFFVSSNAYLAKRYEGDIIVNPFGQWGLIAAYMCVTFGGLLHAHVASPPRRRLVLVLAMTPPIMIMLIQSAKGLFFLAIALVLAGHMIKRLLENTHPFVDLSALASQAKYALLALPLILISFLTRGLFELEDRSELTGRMLAYLASYAFMHIYAFSDWFSATLEQPSLQSYAREPLTWGFYTFIAAFKILGSPKEVPAGVYDEYYSFGDLSPGNIYTVFRGMITDFGLVGTPLVWLTAGALFNFAFKRALYVRLPTFSYAAILLFVHVLYTSYIVSALIWNTTYLVAVIMGVIFFGNKIFWHTRFKILDDPGRQQS